MKDLTTVLLASLFVGFVLLSLFSLDRRNKEYGLITGHGRIANSADELLETILLHRRK